jgi:hypothetical protein
MRRQILHALSAVLAAGGTVLLTVGGAGAAADAAASTHATSHPIIYTSSQGGYTASGRWFRFVATTVKVPAAGAYSNYAEVVLGGATVSPVTLAVAAGGGRTSVGWSVGVPPFGTGGGALTKVDPSVGDTVLIDLYYDRSGGGIVATASDLTNGRTQAITISAGTKALFTAAEVAAVLRNPGSSPSGDSRLWQFTKSAVTTYTGRHGTMTGPWTTNEVVDTTNGTSSGQVVLSPSFLFSRNADFGAWIRAFLLK